jgi:murein DD-endopeptidase MepM/ murein hydrolase activator NlpD
MEKIINVAGLDPKKIKVPHTQKPLGQGGPFIPATAKDLLPAGNLKDRLTNLEGYLNRLNDLKRVMERLPLSAPVDNYSISSRFGKRRDPINNRWSQHYGVDFGGVLRQSVYAPAPGNVSFAGWNGKYGRYIEIDHGSGVKTRYAHLHKILVKRGQKVRFRDKIGLLGSSGRSTGAHLHYETVFRGKLMDPLKFLKAGKYVFQER